MGKKKVAKKKVVKKAPKRTATQSWVERAYLQAQAEILKKLVVPNNHVSEDAPRDALKEGLERANAGDADRVDVEEDAPWSVGVLCVHCGNPCIGPGRPLQHDVFVAPAAGDAGLLCEVKWLKQASAHKVAMDIWKLALTRGTEPEATSIRTFLLIGGEADGPRRTCVTFENNGFDLPIRRMPQSAPGRPRIFRLNLESFLGTSLGKRALMEVLCRGDHFRTPPDVWKVFRLRPVMRWAQTVGDDHYLLALVEMDRVAGLGVGQLTGAEMTAATSRKCP